MGAKKSTAKYWYLNRTWTKPARSNFFSHLKRARHKTHYLCLQASELANVGSHKTFSAALELCTLALSGSGTPDQSHLADLQYTQAKCFDGLDRVNEALLAYEKAFQCQRQLSHFRLKNLPTNFGIMIVRRKLSEHYDAAISVLSEFCDEFPFYEQQYKEYAIRALIAVHKGMRSEASELANLALIAAKQTHSELSRHPSVGLVRDVDSSIHKELINLAKERGGG